MTRVRGGREGGAQGGMGALIGGDQRASSLCCVSAGQDVASREAELAATLIWDFQPPGL